MMARQTCEQEVNACGAPGKDKQCKRGRPRWWERIDDDCPISLVPICELTEPPFALFAAGCSHPHYYDARFLASYLVSSADFIDPVNRQLLTRQECAALDIHLRRHHADFKVMSVADAFDLFQKRCASGDDPAQREATAVLQHLFRFRSARQTRGRGSSAQDTHDSAAANSSDVSGRALPDFDREAFPSLNGAEGPDVQRRHRGSFRPLPMHGRSGRAARRPRHGRIPSPSTTGDLSRSGIGGMSSHALASEIHSDSATSTLAAEETHCSDTSTSTEQGSNDGVRAPLSTRALEFMLPLNCESAVDLFDFQVAERDALIEEETEVLKSIYGDDHVSISRSQDDREGSCWEITIDSAPWHLHVLIPRRLPYPNACPLVCPRLDDVALCARQTQSIVEALGAVAQRSLGDALIFGLVEELKDAQVHEAKVWP
eukprot:TRINITY_DN64834_c0_g1_i1.p1 TRINITY_DN64834_c0_g1~~TRINITY_DN64834_c0_g1_i1.p1  ORF type:complete len:448 (-),score=72.47 TRINITY_DN64834_c0_g1_i1:136-1425(-)